MTRLICVLCFLLCNLAEALACQLATADRHVVLASYVENARACLAAPQDPLLGFETALEEAFVLKVNAERAERDLDPLQVRLALRPAARFHSLDMAYNAFFGHYTPSGRSQAHRISALDRTLLAIQTAENIARFGPVRCHNHLDQTVSCKNAPGFIVPSALSVVDDLHRQLMQSDSHRANILDPAMTHIAVGVVHRDTGYYVTQLFIQRAGELQQPLPQRLATGRQFDLRASIPGWQTTKLAVARDADLQDLSARTLPDSLSGDYTLHIRAEQTLKRQTDAGKVVSKRWIYPAGPAFTVSPARSIQDGPGPHP